MKPEVTVIARIKISAIPNTWPAGISFKNKRLVNILNSFVFQQVIMFSETQFGLYDAHTVANLPSGLVAISATNVPLIHNPK
jgi:hypothetical protein